MTQQPDWEEVGTVGDVNWPEYDGGAVFIDKTGVYPPEIEYVEGPGDDVDLDRHPNAKWTVYRVPLEKVVPDWGDIESVADSTGQDADELRANFESDDPMERASAYQDWAGHYGWFEFDNYPLKLTRLEVEKRYDADLGGRRAIESALEEEVERMADDSGATSWSTLGDQTESDLESEGYEPAHAVCIGEFGDALAVNGDILVDPNWETLLGLKQGKHPRLWSEVGSRTLEGWLEKNGYELTNFGGRVPSSEEHVSVEHVVEAVAKRLKLTDDDVNAVVADLGWDLQETPASVSGDTSVWAKRKTESKTEESRRRRPMGRSRRR